MEPINAQILTIKEVATYLRVTEKTVYRLLAKNNIPAFKVGGSWRFRKSDINEWIKNSLKKKNQKQTMMRKSA